MVIKSIPPTREYYERDGLRITGHLLVSYTYGMAEATNLWVDQEYTRRGIGTKLMRQFLADVDKFGLVARLIPVRMNTYGMETKQLEFWYGKLGFVLQGNNTYMYRGVNGTTYQWYLVGEEQGHDHVG